MPRARRLALLAAIALLAACAGHAPPPAAPEPEPAPAPAPEPAPPEPVRPVPPRLPVVPSGPAEPVFIYYGTDRAPGTDTAAYAHYGAGQGELEYGVVRVSMPTDRSLRPTGAVPPVPMLGPLRRAPDPKRDIFVERTSPLPAGLWVEQVQRQLAFDSTRSVLVYVHGFANTFEDAVRRGAQLAYDLPFRGAMLVYSWPSRGDANPVAYFRDDKTINGSQAPLKEFLETVIDRTGAEHVHVVAHSMGTLLVARTLKEMADNYPGVRFDQVVLAAPDIDTTAFRRSFAPALTRIATRLTVYTSRFDRALDLAQRASSYPRVGQAGPGMQVLPDVDTIDASVAGSGDYGHGYFSGSNAVMSDLREVLLAHPPSARRLLPRLRGLLTFWELLGGSP